MVYAPTTTVIAPVENESQTDFVVRAHQQLMAQIPEPTDRNRVVWDAWESRHPDTERRRAAKIFDASRYDVRSDVCYFAEHESTVKDADGNAVIRKYGVDKLSEIVDENNLRIADMDAFPTIIDRHTAPAGSRDPSPPRTLGATGPLRIGMAGRVNPRFAIFGDEFTRKDAAGELAARPGRSVEVLTLKANGRTYINPIAAISEAPRLPLPLQFAFGQSDAEIVERYSVVAPATVSVAASPGGGNTYVQKFDSQSPDGDTVSQVTSQESGTMQDQDIRQIIDALMSTPQMQWVGQQMQTAGAPPEGAQPEGAPEPAPAAQPAQQFGMANQLGMPNRFSADQGEDLERDFGGDSEYAELSEKYSVLSSSQTDLINDLAQANGRLASLEVERTDAVRKSRLQDIASRLPVDMDSEVSQCLYSAGSSMDDEAFESHCDTIERYAAKSIENVPALPAGELPGASGDRETSQYQAQLSETVRVLANEHANRGEPCDYNMLKVLAKKRISGEA